MLHLNRRGSCREGRRHEWNISEIPPQELKWCPIQSFRGINNEAKPKQPIQRNIWISSPSDDHLLNWAVYMYKETENGTNTSMRMTNSLDRSGQVTNGWCECGGWVVPPWCHHGATSSHHHHPLRTSSKDLTSPPSIIFTTTIIFSSRNYIGLHSRCFLLSLKFFSTEMKNLLSW